MISIFDDYLMIEYEDDVIFVSADSVEYWRILCLLLKN